MLFWGCCPALRLLPCPGTHSTSCQQGGCSVLPQVWVSGAISRGRTWRHGVWVTRSAGKGVAAEPGREVSRQKGCNPCGAQAESQAGLVNHAFLPVSPHRL